MSSGGAAIVPEIVSPSPTEYYYILSIDGGGIFGKIPASFLRHVDVTCIDMFAGTSVGSELALTLASGMSPTDVYLIFESMAYKVFQRSFLRRLTTPFQSKYSDKELNAILQRVLPMKLCEINKAVLIPTKDLANDKFKVWDNIVDYDDQEIRAWEVARMSSAAPTYFAPWRGYVDGGWCANNPTAYAVAAAIGKLHIPPDRIRVLSLGTGRIDAVRYDPHKMSGWGPAKFIKPLVAGVTKSNEQAIKYLMQVTSIYLSGYDRYNPVQLDASWEMDDISCFPELGDRISHFTNDFINVWEKFIS